MPGPTKMEAGFAQSNKSCIRYERMVDDGWMVFHGLPWCFDCRLQRTEVVPSLGTDRCHDLKSRRNVNMFLITMPGAPSSVLAPSSKARSP